MLKFNIFKYYNGKSICFLGHTDVVPPGEIKKWNTDPFDPQIKNDVLYGRGASDMKSSIVSFLFAVRNLFMKFQIIS